MYFPFEAHIAEQFFAAGQGFHATEPPVSPFDFGGGSVAAFSDRAIKIAFLRNTKVINYTKMKNNIAHAMLP